jgi:Ca2+-binding EF-hand superfamily protein
MQSVLSSLSVLLLPILIFIYCINAKDPRVQSDIDIPYFKSWDTNSNESIDSSEFCQRFNTIDLFNNWDLNGNGVVETNEFSQSLRKLWDSNENDTIEVAEWNMYSSIWLKKTTSFKKFDYNRDNSISKKELIQGIAEDSIITTWDKNKDGLKLDEFCHMAFTIWDNNNNGYIDILEWSVNWFSKRSI